MSDDLFEAHRVLAAWQSDCVSTRPDEPKLPDGWWTGPDPCSPLLVFGPGCCFAVHEHGASRLELRLGEGRAEVTIEARAKLTPHAQDAQILLTFERLRDGLIVLACDVPTVDEVRAVIGWCRHRLFRPVRCADAQTEVCSAP